MYMPSCPHQHLKQKSGTLILSKLSLHELVWFPFFLVPLTRLWSVPFLFQLLLSQSQFSEARKTDQLAPYSMETNLKQRSTKINCGNQNGTATFNKQESETEHTFDQQNRMKSQVYNQVFLGNEVHVIISG